MKMVFRWSITCVVVVVTGCFSKPDRPTSVADAVTDVAPVGGPPRFVTEKHGTNVNATTMTLSLVIPEGDSQLLLAGVHLGTSCANAIPSLAEIAVGAQELSPLAEITGSPCGGGSRSELRTLVAPPTGGVDISFTLDGVATSFHAFAILVDHVSQADPIRVFTTASDQGASSSISIDSAPDDLVIDTVAHGNGIMRHGAAQTPVYTQNVSPSTTLDNSGASSRAGDAAITMTWEFQAVDEWHALAVSIQPPEHE